MTRWAPCAHLPERVPVLVLEPSGLSIGDVLDAHLVHVEMGRLVKSRGAPVGEGQGLPVPALRPAPGVARADRWVADVATTTQGCPWRSTS